MASNAPIYTGASLVGDLRLKLRKDRCNCAGPFKLAAYGVFFFLRELLEYSRWFSGFFLFLLNHSVQFLLQLIQKRSRTPGVHLVFFPHNE